MANVSLFLFFYFNTFRGGYLIEIKQNTFCFGGQFICLLWHFIRNEWAIYTV